MVITGEKPRKRKRKRERERNKRQDEPRARKSTRIRVRAFGCLSLSLVSLPVVRRLEKNLISDERSPYLCARATKALGPLRSAQSVPSLPSVCVNAALFLKILSSVLPLLPPSLSSRLPSPLASLHLHPHVYLSSS